MDQTAIRTMQELLKEEHEEGVAEGVAQERANTERERLRADEACRRADTAESELEKYKKRFGPIDD